MRLFGLLIFILFFGFLTNLHAQNGSAGQPFTSLGQAQNVATDGVYYFSLPGASFSTYVRVGGWVQVAIDFDSGVGNLPQSTALSNTVRGILSPSALSTLGSATVTRVLTSHGQLDVQNTRPGIINRIVNNQTLLATGNDNADNNTNWTGTNTLNTSFAAYGNTTAYGLNQNIFHAGGNGNGIHWIPYFNMQQIKNSAGEIPNGAYFQLLVRAPMVAVVIGPTINTQPSTTAQTVCLNSAATALSVSASSPNGSAITYQWYSNVNNSNGGGTAIGGATSANYTPPSNVAGTKYYYVICTNNQGSTTSNVCAAINTQSPSVGGTASSNQSICGGTSPANLSLASNTGSIQWQLSNDNITFTNIAGATSSILTSAQMGVLNATRYYRANVTNGVCTAANSNTVTITVNSAPTFTSTTGASICGTGTATLQATAAAGTINWYAASTGGASLGTGTSFTTPSINTTTTYYADVTNNGCISNPRTAVIATVSAAPNPTITQTGCGTLSIGNLTANALDLGANNNSSNYVTIPSTINSTLNTNNITLEGWFYFSATNAGLPMLIGEAYNVDANITYCIHRSGNQIIAGFYNGGWQAASSTTSIPINTWIHIASTYDQNQVKLYFNGVLNATFNSNQTLPVSNGQPWYLGKRWDHLETLSAAMDEIRIWNVARTQAQIQASMNTSVPTNSAGLRAYYKLDESSGNTAADATGNGYNGTLSNSPTWQVPSTSPLNTNGNGNTFTYLWSPGGQTTSSITPATSGTYSAVVTNAAGCQSAPVSSSIIIGGVASSSQTVCPGLLPGPITLTNYSGSIQWQTSNDNVTFTNIAGQTTATLAANAIGIMAGTKYIRAMLTNGACVAPSNTITLSPANVNILTPLTASSLVWNGQSSNNWGTLSNWYSYNGTSLVPAVTLPNNASHIVIPANTGCILTQPTLSSGAVNVNSLVLEPGSQLTHSGGTFWVWTNLIKNGNLTSTGGFIVFFGSNSGTISGNGTIQLAKMRVNKSAGATLTLQIPVTVSDSLHMWQGNIYTTANNLLTLGLNSASPGTLNYNSGTIVGPFRRFFANAAISGLAGRFPVGTATYNRYAQFDFGTTPGVDQSLTVQYVTGTPNQAGSPLYNGLPLIASGSLMQNYSADGYWNVIPTNNDYTSTINTTPYDVTLFANNLTGMQTPQVCRIIKSGGSNTAAQHHVAWQACGTHTAINGAANPQAFLISSTASQGFSWFNIGTPNSQALPVEFAGMTTTCKEEAVSIKWTTESEHNNDYFRLEKSTDGSAWDILGYVDAVGNSSVLNGYEYLDLESRSNTYYRLYQVNQDGSEELLSTLYSDCDAETSEIASYPNPSHESFSIYWKQFNTSGDGIITIRDINGKTLHRETVGLSLGENLFMIKAYLAPGVYMIELMDDNYERRLIKHVVN